MSSPLAAALREKYPKAHIAWLVQSGIEGLLSEHPALDEVIVWPRKQWTELWKRRKWPQLIKEIRAFIRQLRSRKFDTAIDAQGLLKSAIWVWLSGAKTRIGLGSKEGSGRLMTSIIGKPRGDKRIGSEYRRLMEQLDLKSMPFKMLIALTEEDERFVEKLIADNALVGGYTVICPFTTRPQKHWVEAYWSDLSGRLAREWGTSVVMLGGANDQQAAARICGTSGSVIDLCGRTTLRQSAAVISRASLLIGVDTGLTHMGTAFSVPTIAIFGSTCPYLETDSKKTVVLYKGLECSPCRRNPTCGGAYPCMSLVTVDEVAMHVESLIAKRVVS